MDQTYYLNKFQDAVNGLNIDLFNQQQLELKVGVWLNSVVLKIQNSNWLNQSATAKPFQEGIFFSVWLSDDIIREGKLYYNIHALKLRELTAYKIKSRDFAAAFRQKFKPFENQWPNISTNFGPLTLMEGWLNLNDTTLEKQVADLALSFLAIAPIVNQVLNESKK